MANKKIVICKNCEHEYKYHSPAFGMECQHWDSSSGICGCTDPEPIEVDDIDE